MARKKTLLMVDGYNIMNQWDALREEAEHSLEGGRETLIHILEEYAHHSKINITVVFDAYRVKGKKAHVEYRQGIKIVFTEELETADQYIERYLDRYGQTKQIRVATSDRLEQEMILARGGTRLSARELQAEIQDSLRESQRKQQRQNTENNDYMSRTGSTWKATLRAWKDMKPPS